MPHPSRPSCGPLRRARRRRAHQSLARNALAALLCLTALGGGPVSDDGRPAGPDDRRNGSLDRVLDVRAASERYGWMFDPAPMLAAEARRGWQGAPREATFLIATQVAPVPSRAATVILAAVEPSTPRTADRSARPLPEVARAVVVPLPMPRPSELLARTLDPRLADRRVARRTRTAALPAATGEALSFFEELFGARKEPATALAYAALQNDAIGGARGRLIPQPDPAATAGTTI